MLAIKQLSRSPGSQTSEEIDYFKAVFLLKTATKTRPSVRDEFLTSRRSDLLYAKSLETSFQSLLGKTWLPSYGHSTTNATTNSARKMS